MVSARAKTMAAAAAHADGEKALTVHAPHLNETFEMALFPGTSDRVLQATLASRARLPPVYHDGTHAFYLTDAQSGRVVPLCADGLPSGKTLTLHVNAPPPPATAPATEGAVPASAPAAAAPPRDHPPCGGYTSFLFILLFFRQLFPASFRLCVHV